MLLLIPVRAYLRAGARAARAARLRRAPVRAAGRSGHGLRDGELPRQPAALVRAGIAASVRWTACTTRLLTRPVVNGARFARGALFTGSNASGKSTFLKAAAVNAVLAQDRVYLRRAPFCAAAVRLAGRHQHGRRRRPRGGRELLCGRGAEPQAPRRPCGRRRGRSVCDRRDPARHEHGRARGRLGGGCCAIWRPRACCAWPRRTTPSCPRWCSRSSTTTILLRERGGRPGAFRLSVAAGRVRHAQRPSRCCGRWATRRM